LVFEAIKKWRKNRTTIVITHDLSQIQNNDFLYLMKNGRVVEQGFRSDLIMKENSEFGIMATVQAQVPFPAEDRDPWETGEGIEIMVEDDTSMRAPYLSLRPNARQSIRPQSVYKSNGYSAYLDILSDYHRSTVFAPSDASSKRVSTLMVPGQRLSHRHSMLAVPNRLQAGSPLNVNRPGSSMSRRPEYLEDEQGFVDILEKKANEYPALETQSPRIRNRRKWDASDEEASDIQIKIDGPEALPDAQDSFIQPSTAPPSIPRLLVRHFRGIPQKYLGVLGLIGAVGHGILTPMWAKEIAILMSTVSVGGDNVSYISSQSLRVLGITIADASALAGQYFFLEKMAGEWVGGLRAKAYNLVVAQPQAWFDHRENGSSRLVQILTKDAEDMMPMISTIIGQSTMVVVMIVAGIAWALVTGWKLTLIGMAVMPAFAVITLVQSKVLAILEARNKLAREQVARTFYEVSDALSLDLNHSDLFAYRAPPTSAGFERWL
jgi:ATP-binding cassette subfamily B (MDR/TAP) protein 1